MACEFKWEIPERVGIYDLGEIYSFEDAIQLKSQMLNLLEHSALPLHIMIDICQLKEFPKRMNAETWAMAEWMRHSKLGWLIIINNGINPMANFLVTSVGKVIGVNTRFVKTHEEAMEILLRMDQTLKAA